jgi:hypothetical protein
MKTLQEVLDASAADAGPAMAATFTREDRRLDAEGFREFWKATRMFAVATANSKGDPHIAPVHVLLQDDDSLEMAIFEDSVRLRDLRRNPKIAITSWAEDGRVAIVYGTCSEVPDSRRPINAGGNLSSDRHIITMRIEMTRAYAMHPRRG